MVSHVRRKSLWNLIPSLGLVVLLAAIAAFLLPRSRINYIGLNTARIKTVYTFQGFPVTEVYRDMPLTTVLEKYLGPLPAETQWQYMNEGGDGLWALKASGWGEHIYYTNVGFAEFIECKHSQMSGTSYFDMTDEAKRFALLNYVESLKISERDKQLFGTYAWDVQTIVGYLDHPALPQDIPTIDDVRDQKVWKATWEPRIDKLQESWTASHP
jgi:hypothetical protein